MSYSDDHGYQICSNKRGVVSFEYVLVTFFIIGVVALAFPGNLATILANALTAIGIIVNVAVATA